MSDIRSEREFPVSPVRLFEALSRHADIIQWWGHESWTLQDETWTSHAKAHGTRPRILENGTSKGERE